MNISLLTGEDVKQGKGESYIDEIVSKISSYCENKLLLDFSEKIVRHFPKNFLEMLSEEDLISLMKLIFNTLEKRKRKKYFIEKIEAEDKMYLFGNFSIIAAITDDRPFLVDSIREYLFDVRLHHKFIIHPILSVDRDKNGLIKSVNNVDCSISDNRESFVIIFLDETNDKVISKVIKDIEDIYRDVVLAVDDYPKMYEYLKNQSKHYQNISPDVSEFIQWLLDDNFIIQGVRVVKDIMDAEDKYSLEQLGVYRLNRTVKMIPSIINAVRYDQIKSVDGYPIVIDKAIYRSTVKNRTNYDRIIFIDKRKDIFNIISVIGVFTKKGIATPPHKISLLRKKIYESIESFNFVKGSHDYKWVSDIIAGFPKIEIFNFDSTIIKEIIDTILTIHGKNQVRIFWKDFSPQKNLYILITIPVEKFSNELVVSLKEFFEEYLDSKILDISLRNDDHGYVFAHFNIYLKKTESLKLLGNQHMISEIEKMMKEWNDYFYEVVSFRYSGHEIDTIFQKYSKSFSDNYKVKCSPSEAIFDISILEKFVDSYSSLYKEGNKVILKVYSEKKILLTDLMPVIGNIGLKVEEEDIFNIKINEKNAYIINIYLDSVEDSDSYYGNYKLILPELIIAVINENVENDRLNSLVILSKLNYRKIDLVRSIRNYLEQIMHRFRRITINETLINNYEISRLLVEYFDTKFNPEYSKKDRLVCILEENILQQIDKVKLSVEDSILRCFFKILKNMLRTNFYIEPVKEYISFKINSRSLDILPEPKPLFEIYVHSSQMEGIHLRGGRVARGGLRFSDRADDFRTEVLGLMKTQMVKNSVIVPVGSKGGFIVKKRFENSVYDREHVIMQYKNFIRGLLDITDSYHSSKNSATKYIVCYDKFDPYLVVAADKGTAAFSDIANSVSLEYKFWLGDAFASGGSAGYDHKKVGITAKGAWECVKRHFRETGKDIQKEIFTAVGIGDMSGDVFGNGMLLSKKMKLIAAFNHLHIFIDPNPDPMISWNERNRLFRLQKSNWTDYNRDLLSKGGAVFDRSAKQITINEEIKTVLNTDKESVSGDELVKLILKCNAELLWNGGIGTYFKASTESNNDVGDKTNDAVRINVDELNVSVVGEGGNLGFTQTGRIRYAISGGRINTDAIDNSAGVDMSDHEVNIKIIMEYLTEKKLIKDIKERNSVIMTLTDEVSSLVLKDNFEQSKVISCDMIRAAENINEFIATSLFLQDNANLNFEIEKILFIKENRMITRPEMSVLLAYAKLYLYEQILDHIDLKDEMYKRMYMSYYPKFMVKEYGDILFDHKLVREITATVLVNKVINQCGINAVFSLYNKHNKPFHEIMKMYVYAEKILSHEAINEYIANAESSIESYSLYDSIIQLEKTVFVFADWLLSDSNYSMLENNMAVFIAQINMLHDDSILKKYSLHDKSMLKKLADAGFSKTISSFIESDKIIRELPYIFNISIDAGIHDENVLETYYNSKSILKLDEIEMYIMTFETEDYWEKQNKINLLEHIKMITKSTVTKICNNSTWWNNLKKNNIRLISYFDFIESLDTKKVPISAFNVVLNELANIING